MNFRFKVVTSCHVEASADFTKFIDFIIADMNVDSIINRCVRSDAEVTFHIVPSQNVEHGGRVIPHIEEAWQCPDEARVLMTAVGIRTQGLRTGTYVIQVMLIAKDGAGRTCVNEDSFTVVVVGQ